MVGVESITEGWIMVSISSLSCVLGASIVVILGGDNNSKSLISNKKFLSGSMALGGGVLIFNSLYTLLPASQQKLNSNLYTFLFFFIGVLFTVFLTWSIQWCTPLAIHTCDPIAVVITEEEQQKALLLSAAHGDNSDEEERSMIDEFIMQQDQEQETLLTKSILQPRHQKSHQHHSHQHHHHSHSHHHHHYRREGDIEYGSIMITSSQQQDNIITTEKNDYFRIGIQTAIAICIHKFPEGLIMFVSNQSSSQLGLSVAAAMTIHNFIEGFLIALPLYYATSNKVSAFAYASLLGGMSQPLGAVLGLLAIRNVNTTQEQLLFGIIFGLVSGMMCLIAVQSMLPQAIRADASQKIVPLFFFIGIFLVGLSSLLQSI